jgi:hypothetical protein
MRASILNDRQLRTRIADRNGQTLQSLVRHLRSPLGVIPFIGAGLSASVTLEGTPSKFPQWGELLTGLAGDRRIATKVKALLKAGDYEQAASTVDRDRPGILPQRIRDAFDRNVPQEELLRGAVSYVPFLATGPVITTNYDRVLEQAFAAAGREFKAIISGPLPDATVSAIHCNERALLKIHGDCRDRTFRVFTVEEYRRAYGGMSDKPDRTTRAEIGSLAWLLFTNRPLLFLGCSLAQDRTVHILRSIRGQLSGVNHYAVMEADRSSKRWDARQQHLDKLGVLALWFAPGQYGDIANLLREALERASTRLLPVPGPASPPPPPPPVTSRVTIAKVGELLPDDPSAAHPNRHSSDIALIARDLCAGKLAFFLGAYAGLDQSMLGDVFYQQLAQTFDCPALVGDRTAVASYVISRHGRHRLWQVMRSILEPSATQPSAVHRLIAALPAFLREEGTIGPLVILTTNYDTRMERAMDDAGETFRLLYYANDYAEGDGCFIERSPGGALRRIERPENLREVGSPEHILVKLNGGLTYGRGMPEQVSIERADFERLAAHIPGILPGFLRSELRRRSLLFLGHGLAEPDVHAVIKYGRRADNTLWAWAVKSMPADPEWRRTWQESADYLRVYGLKILDDDLTRFTTALYRHLLSRRQK